MAPPTRPVLPSRVVPVHPAVPCAPGPFPCDKLHRELGLPPVLDPLFDGQHAPGLVLALFSTVLAQPQPDWPPQTRVTGFPFFDQDAEYVQADELRRFLDAGPAPVVFTLGTSAVLTAGDFYSESLKAVRLLGRRAVPLVGNRSDNLRAGRISGDALACSYAPHSELFPHRQQSSIKGAWAPPPRLCGPAGRCW